MYSIDNLVSNYNSGINLEETLEKILIEIKKAEKSGNEVVYRNLIAWKEKYIKKIKKIKRYLEAAVRGGEEGTIIVIKSYLVLNGLKFERTEINKFDKKIKTDVGTIDLIGYTENEKYIIEIKNCPAKPDVIGQILGYWQYLKEAENKEYSIIIIAPSFTNKYKYALKAIKGIDIYSLTYSFSGEELEFTLFSCQ